MVMVSARLTRRWRLSYRHDIDERGHRRPARRLVALRRAAYVAVHERRGYGLTSTSRGWTEANIRSSISKSDLFR